MTTITEPRELWSTMPGWGIVANLLPPEVLQARRVRAVRKGIVILLCALLVLAGAGYAYAYLQSRSAAQSLAAEQARTSQLLVEQNKYSGVTQIQGDVAHVQKQLTTLMKSDVDVPNLLGRVLSKLPAGASVSQMILNISVPSTTAPPTANGTTSLDTSGQTHIGTMAITGTARTLIDVSTFVDAIGVLPGVVDPFPTANAESNKGATFTLQLTLTDQLLSHRFDTTSPGGK
jgi:type IV pilus assembly protein PilN